MTNNIYNFEDKFSSMGSLSHSDCEEICNIIAHSLDNNELESAIRLSFKACSFCERAMPIYDRYCLYDLQPGLTAACLKELYISEKIEGRHIKSLEDICEYQNYDTWYDEINFALTLVYERNTDKSLLSLSNKLEKLENEAIVSQDTHLANYIESLKKRYGSRKS